MCFGKTGAWGFCLNCVGPRHARGPRVRVTSRASDATRYIIGDPACTRRAPGVPGTTRRFSHDPSLGSTRPTGGCLGRSGLGFWLLAFGFWLLAFGKFGFWQIWLFGFFSFWLLAFWQLVFGNKTDRQSWCIWQEWQWLGSLLWLLAFGFLAFLANWILAFGFLAFWLFGNWLLAFWLLWLLGFWASGFFGFWLFWLLGLLAFWLLAFGFWQIGFWLFGFLAFGFFGFLASWLFGSVGWVREWVARPPACAVLRGVDFLAFLVFGGLFWASRPVGAIAVGYHVPATLGG